MAPPTIHCPEGPSRTGAYRIWWEPSTQSASAQNASAKPLPGKNEDPNPEATTPAQYRLEEDGQLLYQGPHVASTVSGRPAGDYQYRVATLHQDTGQVNAWSAVCHVQVAPPSLPLALTLLGLGLLVFAATVLLIVRGHQKHRQGELS